MNVVAFSDGRCIDVKEVDTVEFDMGLKWSPTAKVGNRIALGPGCSVF